MLVPVTNRFGCSTEEWFVTFALLFVPRQPFFEKFAKFFDPAKPGSSCQANLRRIAANCRLTRSFNQPIEHHGIRLGHLNLGETN